MNRRKIRNPIARALRSPAFRQRTVRNRKTYTRKGRPPAHGAADDPGFARPPGLRAARGDAALSSGAPGWQMVAEQD